MLLTDLSLQIYYRMMNYQFEKFELVTCRWEDYFRIINLRVSTPVLSR